MKYETGNIWNIASDAKCITTNSVVKRNGTATMGAGLAKQANDKYPILKYVLGTHLMYNGNIVGVFHMPEIIITVPTKHHWRNDSDIDLIEESLKQLKEYVDTTELKVVLITPLGCGLGRLDWNVVQPMMEHYLDDRFVCIK